MEWSVDFEHSGTAFTWRGRAEADGGASSTDGGTGRGAPGAASSWAIVRERIEQRGGPPLVERDGDGFRLGDQELPPLPRGESAVALLSRDPRVAPVNEAWRQVLVSAFPGRTADPSGVDEQQLKDSVASMRVLSTLEAFRNVLRMQGAVGVGGAPLFQHVLPDDFAELCADFTSIFPSVQELEIAQLPVPGSSSNARTWTRSASASRRHATCHADGADGRHASEGTRKRSGSTGAAPRAG
jgi:hypothetical protein